MRTNLNMEAVIAWMYISETLDRCPKGASNSAGFMRLMLDLLNFYPAELDAVLAVRGANLLMEGKKHD
jgi:hypothetical protein